MDLQESSMAISAPEIIFCEAGDLDFTQVSSIEALDPKTDDLRADGWLWFNNLAVNNEVGNQLIRQGQPLRGQRIRMFAADVSWRYGFNFTTAIKSPQGRGILTDSDWRFPGLYRYGIVLFQKETETRLKAWTLKESTRQYPQEIEVWPDRDLYINVNDGKGNYRDNTGSFDLLLQVIA